MAKVSLYIPTDTNKWVCRNGRMVIQNPGITPVAAVVGAGWDEIKDKMQKSFPYYLKEASYNG